MNAYLVDPRFVVQFTIFRFFFLFLKHCDLFYFIPFNIECGFEMYKYTPTAESNCRFIFGFQTRRIIEIKTNI